MMAILNLLKDLVKEKDVELIEKGLLAAQMQECLINDILDVAKINNGSLEITHCYTNVRKLITSIYDMFRIKLEPHISFSVKITNPFPTMISIDERRFKQILLNLLSNSAKFTQTGFISIDASYQNGVLSCSVIDSGIGIPKEESAKIFTQFGTIKASSSINSAGSGLGLNLCKKLCLLMNGNIEFKSDPHIKTCFTFWFPADCKPSCDEIEIEMESPVESVLHVDDDYLNICILNKYASKMGLTYHSYIHAVDAIHNIKEGFKEFSMAFVDINMPDVDGYEVASKIRKMLPQVIIVALTGEERVNVKTKCMQAGFNIIIEKPISFDRYKSCVLAHALQ
jgi:CheY-like chemotaxis protein